MRVQSGEAQRAKEFASEMITVAAGKLFVCLSGGAIFEAHVVFN